MISARLRHFVNDCANYADKKKEFHPEPNVKNHLLQVTTLALEANDTWEVCLASLLHDIGKNKDDAKAWVMHAARGAGMASDDVTEKVKWLIEEHMKPYEVASGRMRPHKQEEMRQHPWFADLMRLHAYDDAGRRADGAHMPEEDIYGSIDAMDPRNNHAIVMIGVQACGKSTLARKIVDESRDFGEYWKPKWERTNRDDIRELLGCGPGQWRHQEGAAIRIQQQHIRLALGRGQGVVVDNCHNTVKRRRDILEWLREEFPGISVKAHLVYAPLDVCIRRNREEHGTPHRHRLLIPDKVIVEFHGDLVAGLGKIVDDDHIAERLVCEGFDDVEITRTQ
jgi:predicted kinase